MNQLCDCVLLLVCTILGEWIAVLFDTLISIFWTEGYIFILTHRLLIHEEWSHALKLEKTEVVRKSELAVRNLFASGFRHNFEIYFRMFFRGLASSVWL